MLLFTALEVCLVRVTFTAEYEEHPALHLGCGACQWQDTYSACFA